MENSSKSDVKQLLIIIAMFVVAVMFWNSIFIYPIKLFVVILHEMSHGLMAELMGGDIIEIQIDRRMGGYCRFTIPDSFFASLMTTSAGYLGSLFWGGLILIISSRTSKDKYLTLVIGIVLLWLTWYVIKTGELFGILFTAGFAVFMIAAFKYFPNDFHNYMLRFIGLTSCMYVVIDIKSDLIDRSGIGSDADAIAQLTYIPSVLVGIFWFILAVISLYYIFKFSIKTNRTK